MQIMCTVYLYLYLYELVFCCSKLNSLYDKDDDDRVMHID